MADSKPAFRNEETGEVIPAPRIGTDDGERTLNVCPVGWVPGVDRADGNFHPGDRRLNSLGLASSASTASADASDLQRHDD